jgi:hypothetical protein
MTFINERIPDADLQRIDFSKTKDPLSNKPIRIPLDWTIDRERDIALMSLGGGFGENAMYPHFFILYWQGRIIHVQLSSKFTGNFTTNDLEVTWKLLFHSRLEGVPEPLLIKTIQEALTCYGYLGIECRDKVKASHFDFDGNHLIGG